MNPARRAMTILEVLLSLGLLGMLAMASAGWIATAARTSPPVSSRLAWEQSARALLQLIHDDAASADFSDIQPHERVTVSRDQLRMRTRAMTPLGPRTLWRVYAPDPGSHDEQGVVVRDYSDEQLSRPLGPPRRALGGVTSWTCRLDPASLVLDVALTGPDAATVSRRYQVR